jgi:hypothetical protein
VTATLALANSSLRRASEARGLLAFAQSELALTFALGTRRTMVRLLTG